MGYGPGRKIGWGQISEALELQLKKLYLSSDCLGTLWGGKGGRAGSILNKAVLWKDGSGANSKLD